MFEKCMHDRKPEQATSKLKHGVTKVVMPPNEETSNCSRTEHFLGKQMQTLDALGTGDSFGGRHLGICSFQNTPCYLYSFFYHQLKFNEESLPQLVFTFT